MNAVREIALDTETTGLKPEEGHRIVEIGCVEMMNGIPTGQEFHTYINPERDVPAEASAISGITTEFLKPHPLFINVVDDFLAFIGTSTLIIHNARFDMGFINHELGRLKRPLLPATRATDTVMMARRRFPGSPANLNALCKRFQIDLSTRDKHGAIVDARLLARVYLELKGGRQTQLVLESNSAMASGIAAAPKKVIPPRLFPVSAAELSLHEEALGTLKNPLWQNS